MEGNMTVTELVNKIEALPRRQQEEVAEFVDFLAARYQSRTLPRVSVRGKYADVPTSSDEFARRKSEEIDLEDKIR
jgi:hypothetical protein